MMLRSKHSTAGSQCLEEWYQQPSIVGSYTFQPRQYFGMDMRPTHQAGCRTDSKYLLASKSDGLGPIAHVEARNDSQVFDKLENSGPSFTVFMG
jgi:hypothetical protein